MSQQDAGAAPPPADRARSTGAALEAHYRFLLWLVPAVERFPRSQKFLLGDRIQYTGRGGRVNHRIRLFALPIVERHCRKRSTGTIWADNHHAARICVTLVKKEIG